MKSSRRWPWMSLRYERFADFLEFLKVFVRGVQFSEMTNKVKGEAQDLGVLKGDLTLSQEFFKILR
jgi:hypothetical protein